MFNITSNQINASQNNNEVSPHICKNGYNKKKKPTTTNVGKDMEKGEPSHTVGRNANWCSYCGKQYEGFSKVKIVLPCGPAISLLGINSEKEKTR